VAVALYGVVGVHMNGVIFVEFSGSLRAGHATQPPWFDGLDSAMAQQSPLLPKLLVTLVLVLGGV
jgi:hypothetical protein